MINNGILFFIFCISTTINISWAFQSTTDQIIQIKNENITYSVTINDEKLHAETLSANNKTKITSIVTDANFSLEIVWADWLPPGKKNHGDNPAILSKKDFVFVRNTLETTNDGGQLLVLYFKGLNQHLELQLSYQISPSTYYVKRSVFVKDPIFSKHLLHLIKPLNATLQSPEASKIRIIKDGGFGQPVGLEVNQGGLFFGLEYPAGTNTIVTKNKGEYQLTSKRYVGKIISAQGYQSESVVIGLTPDKLVKHGFMKYLDDIKIQAVKPYTLYNSWYDLRGRGYTVGQYVESLEDIDFMSENNIDRLYQLIKKKFTDRYALSLDAFVLDDGWDIYGSDWVMRPDDFPNGVAKLINKLNNNQTDLGLWFGPSGGYSDRMQRIDWYRGNGYEITGEEKKWGGAQLCFAGQHYRKLFEKRNIEFTQQGVNYYKWDGIQFSCNEADHGHPIGLYSQVAILDTVIEVINKVTEINSDVYHSITSGTWLSPWWLMHANQIWMQGDDFGYSNVPAISARDAAITYRDAFMYDNLKTKNIWFPISNTMTHGIIKGKLEKLHIKESIDKFTDNAMMYFSRGVSMYELYTSPDIMNDNEWQALAQSMHWARHNFDLLMKTEMVGGDPAQGQAYAYVHFNKSNGIIAVRNPSHLPTKITIDLSPEMGMHKDSNKLVLEKTYPYQFISKTLYSSGDTITLNLSGYETSIYEISPIASHQEPLLAGVPFISSQDKNNNWNIDYFPGQSKPTLLNAHLIDTISNHGNTRSLDQISFVQKKPLEEVIYKINQQSKSSFLVELVVNEEVESLEIGFLLSSKNATNNTLPLPQIMNHKKTVTLMFEGTAIDEDFTEPKQESGWYSVNLPSGSHQLLITFPHDWQGDVDLWAFSKANKSYEKIKLTMKKSTVVERKLPPSIARNGGFKRSQKLGHIELSNKPFN